jgi:hypothetical protein
MDTQWGHTAPFPPTICCPLCGGYASLKRTKNGRVTALCSKCSSRMFLNSWPALIGYLELARQVEPHREEWAEDMERRAMEAQAGPQRSVADADQIVLRENLERAFDGDATALQWVMSFDDGSQALTAHMRQRERSAFRSAVRLTVPEHREEVRQ